MAYPPETSGPAGPPSAYPSYSPHFSAPAGPRRRKWVNGLLFALTVVTTTLVGTGFYEAFQSEFGRRDVPREWSLLWNGLWYSLTIIAVLGAHEMGHYLYCRKYGVDATLPFFIPLPPMLGLFGTLGAVIRIRSAFPNRAVLFDIGVAGPIGGMLVIVPAMIFGLTLSSIVPEPTDGSLIYFGEPLLFQWMADLVVGPIPAGQALNMHPVVLACWVGLLATALNLLPFGQLDGGHIVYAILGRRARFVSAATLATVLLLAVFSLSWIAFGVMLLLMWRFAGLGHPPPLNDYERLGSGRLAIAAVAAVMLVVSFTPTLVYFGDLLPGALETVRAAF